jgi:hypothetical protein
MELIEDLDPEAGRGAACRGADGVQAETRAVAVVALSLRR